MRKYSLNEDFFEVINTEEKAYWLGFISADGCIGKNRHGNYIYLTIALQRQDKDHLQKWANAIGYSGPVHDYASYNKDGSINEYSKLTISSNKLTEDLKKLGITERKSLIIRPWAGSDKLMKHYFRGLVDGDGGIYFDKNNGPTRLKLAGTKEVVESFQEFGKTLTGSRTKAFPIKNIWGISFGGTKVAGRIIQEMYNSCHIALTRKLVVARAAESKFMCKLEVT